MMRKKGLLYLVILLLLWAVFAYLFRDSALESLTEKTLQLIAGAKVEVDHFNFSLFDMKCSWDRLQIANKNNPWYNVIDVGYTSFDIETRPLFWKKVIINEMIMEDAKSGTRRETDGSLSRAERSELFTDKDGLVNRVKDALEKQFGELPVFDLKALRQKINVDSLIDIDQLSSVQGYERLMSTADSSLGYWRSQLDPDVYKKRINDLETRIQAVNIEGVRDITTLTTSLQNLNSIYEEVKTLREEVNSKHTAVESTYDTLQSQLGDMKERLNEDISEAQKMAKLQTIDVKDVGLMLFGQPAVNQFEKITEYIALARKYLPMSQGADVEKEAKTPRFKGQNIYFPFKYTYPEFLVKNISVSAASAAGDTGMAYFLKGNLKGLTSQPYVYNNPTRFDLGLEKIGGREYNILGSFDHITEVARDSLWINAKNIALGEINLKTSKYFPQVLSTEEGDFALSGFFIDNFIKINADLEASDVNFLFDETATDQVSRLVQDVLSGLSTLVIDANLIGESSDYKLNMKSNVDNVLGNQIKGILDKNLQEARQQVETYIRNQVDEKRNQVEQLINSSKKTFYAEFENAREKVLEKYNEIEQKKKEIEQRIEEEKAKAKEKGVDAIKDLIKRP
ncbi:TIGR03545 family protein [candidate division KSB1 bacterium]|nr:TIGR03545 family protein [candidate division KSB1 bacterium]